MASSGPCQASHPASRLPTGSASSSTATPLASRPPTNAHDGATMEPRLPAIGGWGGHEPSTSGRGQAGGAGYRVQHSQHHHQQPGITLAGLSTGSFCGGTSSSAAHDDAERPSGLKRTASLTYSKLGMFSSYESAPGAGRLIGSYGYTSPNYTDLRPVMPRTRATKGGGQAPSTAGLTLRPLKGLHLVSDKDVEYLRDRDSDNQAVFETWTKRKQLEAELEKDEAAKREAQRDRRFQEADQQERQANEARYKAWAKTKTAAQQKTQEENYFRNIQMRALQAYRKRLNQQQQRSGKKREEGFSLRSGAAVLPQSFEGFAASSSAAAAATAAAGGVKAQPSATSAASRTHRGPPGHERSAASSGGAAAAAAAAGGGGGNAQRDYQSLLEEADDPSGEPSFVVPQGVVASYLPKISSPRGGSRAASPAAGGGAGSDADGGGDAGEAGGGVQYGRAGSFALPPVSVPPGLAGAYAAPSATPPQQQHAPAAAAEDGAEEEVQGEAAASRPHSGHVLPPPSLPTIAEASLEGEATPELSLVMSMPASSARSTGAGLAAPGGSPAHEEAGAEDSAGAASSVSGPEPSLGGSGAGTTQEEEAVEEEEDGGPQLEAEAGPAGLPGSGSGSGSQGGAGAEGPERPSAADDGADGDGRQGSLSRAGSSSVGDESLPEDLPID